MTVSDRLEWVRERWSFEGGPSQYEAEADINGLCSLVEHLSQILEHTEADAEQIRKTHAKCQEAASDYGRQLGQAIRAHGESAARICFLEGELRRRERRDDDAVANYSQRLNDVFRLVASKEWEALTRESVPFCVYCGMTYTHKPRPPDEHRTWFGHSRECEMFGENGLARDYRQELEDDR